MLDLPLLITLLILLLLMSVFGLWLAYVLIFRIFSWLNYPKSGKFLGLLAVFIIVVFFLFQDFFYTKKDVISVLQEQDVVLKNDFDLENNRTASFLDDYYHKFDLIISAQDKLRLINQIKTNPNFFKISENYSHDFFLEKSSIKEGKIKRRYYETPDFFINEFTKAGKKGYAPTYRKLIISKKESEFYFEEY
jgi:hypothetical protein